MMSMVLPRTCCCTPTVRQWTASLCSNACVVTCSGTGELCIPEITFCDSYRESIGLPKALDTEKCYIMILGGCLFVVNNPTYVSSCDDTPTSNRNIGTLYGVFDKPEGGQCDEICTEIKDDAYLVSADIWTGGFPCGASLTLTYQWGDVYCRNDPFATPGTGSCSPTCVDPCVKKIGTIVSAWSLGQYPDQWFSDPVQCSSLAGYCSSCSGYNPSGYPFWEGRPQYHQIGDNLCPDLPLCTLPACQVVDDFACFVQPVASGFRTYTQALTITRSCVYPLGGGIEWIQGGPDSDTIRIDGCLFRNLGGCKASTLATAINNALGQASQVGSTTFVAVGTDAWIGSACVETSCSVGSACIPPPYLWDGPYFSNSGKTATWYAAPWLTYWMTSSLSSTSFIYNWSESGCRCGTGDGERTCGGGYSFGSTFGYYESNNISDGSGPLIEYGITFTGSTFSMVNSALVTNQPCCTPPIMS